MNLANVIERKGKTDRVLEEVSDAVKAMFDKTFAPFEGRVNNADTLREAQIAASRMTEHLQASYGSLERVMVDVSLSNDRTQARAVTLPRPGVYTGPWG